MAEIVEHAPTPAEYISLRAAVGWKVPSPGESAAALRGSVAAVKALVDGEVVAMGRLVGDGVLYWLVVDVVVHPDHQRSGIGRQIVAALTAVVAAAEGRHVVNVVADPEVAPFCRSLGFEETSSGFLAKAG